MIIACLKCSKKFNIDKSLIPPKGRLLQCNSCNHKWFFKNELIEPIENEGLKILDNEDVAKNKTLDANKKTDIDDKIKILTKEQIKKNSINANIDVKKSNILNLTIIFIISFVALIILVDTFKYQISKIVPNIEFILFNLYESCMDMILFIRDLI